MTTGALVAAAAIVVGLAYLAGRLIDRGHARRAAERRERVLRDRRERPWARPDGGERNGLRRVDRGRHDDLDDDARHWSTPNE